MTVQFEEVEYCKVKVEYQADPEAVSDKRSEILDEFKDANLKVPGFRRKAVKKSQRKAKHRGAIQTKKKGTHFKPGKLSHPGKAHKSKDYERSVLVHYKQSIEDRVRQELLSEAYDEALFETQLKPIGYPQVSNVQLMDNNFSCEMLFAKKPVFELAEYKNFQIPEPAFEKSATDLAAERLQELRVQFADVSPYEENDFVQTGDSITMDVVATCNGEKIEELSQQGLFYSVGESTNNSEFDSGLYGTKAGETKSFTIKFGDEEHLNPAVKNKEVTFEVTVHMGIKKVPAPLDDTLAEKIGLKTIEELQSTLESSIANHLTQQKQSMIREQVINRLVANHDFEVPGWLALAEAQKTAVQFKREWNTLSTEEIDQLMEVGKRKIKVSLILDSIRENEPEASFSEGELLTKFKDHLVNQGVEKPGQVLEKMKSDGSLFATIAHLMDESTIQWIIDSSTIITE